MNQKCPAGGGAGPGGLLLLLLLPARLRRRGGGGGGGDSPGGGGGAPALAPSPPPGAQGTLSRAAAPRPVSSLGLGHGGPAHRRAWEVREGRRRGGRRPPALGGGRGEERRGAGAARGRPLGAVGRGQAAVCGARRPLACSRRGGVGKGKGSEEIGRAHV